MLQSIKWENNTVYILDQRLLPDKVEYLKCTHYEQIAGAIENLSIRGAPAIGIATAWAVAVASMSLNASSSEELFSDLNPVFQRLINTRPTAINIKWAIDRMQNLIKNNLSLPVSELKDMILNEAIRIHNKL